MTWSADVLSMRFLLLLLLIVSARGSSAGESQPVHGRGFSFFCPRSWKVERSSPADFRLYHIETPKGDRMLIYEGNAADFPGDGVPHRPVPSKISGRPALVVKVVTATEIRLDVLIETGFPDWPTQVHVACRPVSRAALGEMERLLKGLIVRENPPGIK